MRCALWALSCLNKTFDMSCKLDISRNLSRLLFRVNCIKKQAEVLPHSPVTTWGFGGLSPSETKFQAPPNWNMKYYKTVMFVQISERQAPLRKCKAIYRTLSGDGSVATPRFLLAVCLVTKTWKFQMRHLLLAKILWSHVDGSANEPREEDVQALVQEGPVSYHVSD